nr:hypothetical protein [Saprospiraceae bacterium]
MKLNDQRIRDLLRGRRVLVVGDVMLDKYISGPSDRMSPEASVPVIANPKTYEMPGGAANVATNLIELGCSVDLMGTTGDDENGKKLLHLCEKLGIQSHFIVHPRSTTTVKCRIIANERQIVRLDYEVIQPLPPEGEKEFKQDFDRIVESGDIEILILQDYNKGIFSKAIIHHVISKAKTHGIFIAVDPKVHNFFEYREVNLFKPNLAELNNAFSKEIEVSEKDLKGAIHNLQGQINFQTCMVTLSERGIITCRDSECVWSPAMDIEVVDVSGAGDTVISVSSLVLFNGGNLQDAADLSNLAAAEVCKRPGVVPVQISNILKK